MARSFSGGTRGFIRGKVANDLYQVTKDARGRKIQLVRAVEESRVNNNTEMQAVARMQMALCMGCLSQFKEIVDHSFEGIPYGQLSIAHFVKLNIPLLQNDCKTNWEVDSEFSYPIKGEPNIRWGAFILSEGTLILPDSISMSDAPAYFSTAAMVIQLDVPQPTMADVKRVLGAAQDDYITGLVVEATDAEDRFAKFIYRRAYLSSMDDSVQLTTQNVARFFRTEGTAGGGIVYDPGRNRIFIEILDTENPDYRTWVVGDIIISVWSGQKWRRNSSRFSVNPNIDWYDYLATPNSVFKSWYQSYDPDQPYNPYER